MQKGWYLILLICVIIIAVFIYDLIFMNRVDMTNQAKKGIFNLQNIQLIDDRVVALNGEWLFHHSSYTVLEEQYMHVPGTWDVQGEPYFSFGSGTYELEIRLHANQIGQTMGLYIPNVATAYDVRIDGQLQLSNGTTGESVEDMVPVNYARTLYFVPESDRVKLSIHVSNFAQRKGGLWDEISFGTANAISLKSEKNIAVQLLVFGALLMMSIYLLIIYFLRRSLISALYLGLLTLIIAMRTLLVGETFFIRVFPTFPWELQVKLEYLTLIMGIPLTIRYIHHLYPEESWSKVRLGVDFVSFLFMIVVIWSPALFYTRYLFSYHLLMLPVVAYMIFVFIKAMIHRRPTAYFNFVCLVIFMIAVLNDALFYFNVVSTGEFASKGFFMFLVSQTLVHGIKYADSFRNIENLSEELNRMNQSLEQKVELRTQELKQANERLQYVEHSRKALISDISHELSGPMTLIQGYVEAIMDRKLPSEEKYWHIVYDKINLLKRLVQDLSALSDLELRNIKIEFQKMSPTDYPQRIYELFHGEIEASGYTLQWMSEDGWAASLPDESYLMIDRDRINQVILNVIHNAVKYSAEEKEITMEVVWIPLPMVEVGHDGSDKIGDLIFKVIDRGSGIDESELPHIFKRLYRGTRTRGMHDDSRGLGLAISKEIMEIHDGLIWAESEINQGSTFTISLPIYVNKEHMSKNKMELTLTDK